MNTRLTILKDEQAPFLQVRLEEQLMRDGQIVPYQPVFEFSLQDFKSPLPLRPEHLQWDCIQPDGSSYPIAIEEQLVEYLTENDNQSLNVVWTPSFSQNGTYRLIVAAEDASGNPTAVFQSSFKIQSEGAFENIQVVPNPNSGQFALRYDYLASIVPEDTELILLDLQGKTIFRRSLKDFLQSGRGRVSEAINCHSCVPGTYIYQIRMDTSLIHEGKLLIIE